jgi:hypothetical protein
MVITATPVGFIGALAFEFDGYGGFGDLGDFAQFLSDAIALVAIAIVIPLVGVTALGFACFVPGRRADPVMVGLASSYVLGFGAVLESTLPRDPLSTLVFMLLALALIAPSLAFLWYARGARRRSSVIA